MVDERLSMKSEVTIEDVSIAEVKPCSNDGSGKRRRLLTYFALGFDTFGRDNSFELVRLGETKECGEGVNASVTVAVAKIVAAIEVGIDIVLTVLSWSQSDEALLSSYLERRPDSSRSVKSNLSLSSLSEVVVEGIAVQYCYSRGNQLFSR